MINKNIKFDFDDLLIQPCSQSKINSRKDVNVYDENNMLPLFTAPMDTVIDIKNSEIFEKNKIYSIIPRTYPLDLYNKYFNMSQGISSLIPIPRWKAVSLNEFENEYLKKDISIYDYNKYVLIDIANGHMAKLSLLISKAKEKHNDLVIMVGNIANPITYKILSENGADYCRLGVGNGGGCLTSQNVAIGYPMASLISECYEISCTLSNPAKIIADGGMKNYSDIIKALALGADGVMLGSILNRALESAGETHKANIKHQGAESWTEPGEIVDQYSADVLNAFQNGAKFYKKFRGMSTKSVQKLLGNETLKTSEGVTRMNPVEYTVEGWIENFTHYLASAMSYTGSSNLNEFIGKVNLNLITQNSFNRFNK